MSAVTVPVGRCRHCGHQRALVVHRSRRDGLLRLLCTPCSSTATVLEEAGETVTWLPGHTEPPAQVDGGLW